MELMDKRTLIFDFDGVVVDSAEVALASFTEATGIQLSREYFETHTIKSILKEQKIGLIRTYFLVRKSSKRYGEKIDSIRAVPGIEDLLRSLVGDFTLAIVTSNSHQNTTFLLKKFGLFDFFEQIITDVGLFGKKKVLRRFPPDSVYIGDEVRDVECCRKVGMRSISTSWGYDSKKLLKEAGAECIVDSVGELERALRNSPR